MEDERTETATTKPSGKAKWVLVGLAALVVIGIAASGNDDPKQPLNATAGDPQPAAEAPADPAEITAAEFAALKTGMSKAAVEAIVGGPGEVLSENEMAGTRTIMLMWKGTSMGANANVMFQDDKMIQKSQFGLTD